MPRLFINEQEVGLSPPALSSIREVVEHIQSCHLPTRSVIRDIRLDGQPLLQSDSGEGTACSTGIGGFERIDITTATLCDVALESLGEAVAYLARIETATPSLAMGFRTTPGTETLENLKQFYEGFYWLNLLLDRLSSSFAIPLDSLAVEGSSAGEIHQKMISILKELISAHERQDHVLVADLLEYEILPVVPSCRSVFAAVHKRIAATAQAEPK